MERSQQMPWGAVEEGQEKLEEIRGSPGKLENTAPGHISNPFQGVSPASSLSELLILQLLAGHREVQLRPGHGQVRQS